MCCMFMVQYIEQTLANPTCWRALAPRPSLCPPGIARLQRYLSISDRSGSGVNGQYAGRIPLLKAAGQPLTQRHGISSPAPAAG